MKVTDGDLNPRLPLVIRRMTLIAVVMIRARLSNLIDRLRNLLLLLTEELSRLTSVPTLSFYMGGSAHVLVARQSRLVDVCQAGVENGRSSLLSAFRQVGHRLLVRSGPVRKFVCDLGVIR